MDTTHDTISAETLETILAAAAMTQPLHHTTDGRVLAILPAAHQVCDVSDPHRLPPRREGAVTVDDRASAIEFVNRFKSPSSILTADIDRARITATLDYHSPGYEGDTEHEVGARKFQCVLALRESEEFRRWNAFAGQMHPQDEFAAFLEENACDVVEPESATLIEVSRDLEATQGVAFKSSTRLESGDRCFRYEEQTSTGELVVPREFAVLIPIYYGEATTRLRAALRFKVSAGGLTLGFEWRRVEHARQELFREIANAVATDTACPVFFGR